MHQLSDVDSPLDNCVCLCPTKEDIDRALDRDPRIEILAAFTVDGAGIEAIRIRKMSYLPAP